MQTMSGKAASPLVVQPRIVLWHVGNRVFNLDREKYNEQVHSPVPEKFWGKELLEVYDLLGASPRYPHEAFPGLTLFSTNLVPGHQVKRKVAGGPDPAATYVKTTTPAGSVVEGTRGGYRVEYPVKKVEDLAVVRHVVEHSEFRFNEVAHDVLVEGLEGRSVPCSYFPRSPIQRCILEFLGFERTALFLRRYPDQVHEFLSFLDGWADEMFDVLCASPVPLLNFGENVDCHLNPPHWYLNYQVPYFEKRVAQLHAAGKLCHAHFDGNLRDLLPHLGVVDFDGIEAATPVPQGDVTLEELREAIPERVVLLDGIPATLFMRQFPEERLIEHVERLIDLFAPRLVVGVSDELPAHGEIRRLEKVARLVRDVT